MILSQGRRKWCRWRRLGILVVVLMSVMNIAFLTDLLLNHVASVHKDTSTVPNPEGDETKKFIELTLTSSKEKASVIVDGKAVYQSDSEQRRGIHAIVLNQATGVVMASRVYDTYLPGSDEAMVVFLNSVSNDRVICLMIQDEGTFSLGDNARSTLKALGSRLSTSLSWRDMWTFVAVKGKGPMGEDVGKSVSVDKWGLPVSLQVTLPSMASVECDWPETPANKRRRVFCSQYEGYGAVCNCAAPLPLDTKAPDFPNNNVRDVPVAVVASNRPHYLFRMLRSVLAAHGSNSSMCTVFVDGFFQEPAAVAELLGVRAVHHEPKSERNGRISQHVKSTLHDAFELFPNAQYSIIIEEDLDVSLDFFKYFSQTIGLMAQDESIYCISAWNDQGYRHSCEDPSLLYRVETMPGLGWVMKRKLFKEELEPIWPGPDKLWDWDMWMRVDGIRKDRECIIPDISRTYHFGAAGLNMNPYFQEHYFNKHKLNTDVAVKLRDVEQLKKEEYEMVIHQLFVNAIVLDHTKNPCSEDFVPKEKDKIFVFYFFMEHAKHFDHWMKLAKCFNLWDLDARGFHKGLWRFWLHGNHILSVGSPYSPYSKKYKPLDLEPLQLT